MTSFRTECHVTWLCMDVERGVASVTMVGLTAEEAPSASAALERMDADEDMRAEAASPRSQMRPCQVPRLLCAA